MSKEDKAVATKKANPLLPHDAKELEKVSDYAAKKEAEVQELSAKFSDMGYIRLLWDSKVPDKDCKFYHFFSLTASNRDDVLNEIEKYQSFYKELGDAIVKVSNPEEQSDSEKTNPYVIILELNEKLSEMAEAAKLGKNTTASSAVYDLHKSFIQKHEKLENMIKRVECVALKEGLKKATDGWQESIQSINNLQNDLKTTEEKYDRMCDRFDRLLLQNELLLDQQKTLLDNNQKMEQQQEVLLQENAAIKTLLRKMAKHENDKK